MSKRKKQNHQECKIRGLHIDVTNRCNLRCEYCFFFEEETDRKAVAKEEPKELTLSEIKTVIDDAVYHGCGLVTLSGGEPFLRKDIFEIIEHGPVLKTILTNGTLLSDPKIFEFLKKTKKIFEVRVSLDGFHGHDQVRRGSLSQEIINNFFKISKETKVSLSVNTVVTSKNIDEIEKLYDLLSSLKIYQWRIDLPFLRGRYLKAKSKLSVSVSQYGRVVRKLIGRYVKEKPSFKLEIFNVFRAEMLEKDWANFFSFDLEAHPCGYYLGSFTIHCDGSVGLCPTLPIEFGNIREKPLCYVINDKPFQKFCKIRVRNIKGCLKCKYLPLCGTGCRADALFAGEGILGKDCKSCLSLKLFEKEVLPLLPRDTKERLEKLFKNNIHSLHVSGE